MNNPKPRRRDLESLCAETGAEDGADPRVYFRDPSNPAAHKAAQLASQIRRTLELTFVGGSREPVLLDLEILSVTPVPDSTHFLIVVTGPTDEAEALAALDRAAGWLRTEVAASIHRRRTPLLSFRFVPGWEGEV